MMRSRRKACKSPEDIFQVKVEPLQNSVQLKWKPPMLETPIFRRAVRTPDGIGTSSEKALLYDTCNRYLKRLGHSIGFSEKLTRNCIRQGTANAVDDVYLCTMIYKVLLSLQAWLVSLRCFTQALPTLDSLSAHSLLTLTHPTHPLLRHCSSMLCCVSILIYVH